MASDTAPAGRLRSAANPAAGTVAPWASYTAQTREHVPELQWPRSNVTYERMLTDSQVWALYSGWVLPAESYRAWVHPNGNTDAGRVAALAEDLGLPVFNSSAAAREALNADEDADSIERTSLPDEFDFADLLHEALFSPIFGHYFFEFAGELDGTTWRMRELAPIHPATISEIRSNRAGGLEYVMQSGAATFSILGGTVWASQAPKIGPERLVPFVWWPDATRRWLGRPMGRPMYRNWLCKDVLIRVDVTNHERAGGVPWVETDERYAGQDLADLQRLAAEFRVDEEGGAALPPGTALKLARAGGTDIVGSIRYHDESMAAVWHAMVRQLGQTPNGSRALGDTFADLETLARRALVEWARKTINRSVCARWWWWNFGERNSPVVRFTPPELEAEAATNRQAPPVVDAAAEVEEAGDDPPPQAATASPSPRARGAAGAPPDPQGVRGARAGDGASAGAARGRRDGAGRAPEAGAQAHAAGAVGDLALPDADRLASGAVSRSRLPDRELRRAPFDHEVRAAVDFAALEVAYEDAAEVLDARFLTEWLPAQLAAVGDAIAYTRSGTPRQRIRAQDMARITAPVVGADDMAEVLHGVATRGASEAIAELGAQGLTLDASTEAELRALVLDHARAVAMQTAEGLSLAASRRAVQLAGAGLSATELAGAVTDHVAGLEHVWERDQLAGAAQQALNAGRLHVFERAEVEVPTQAYASELLDARTCDACRGIDGATYPNVAAARRDYPSGGYQGCAGGPRCRGTVVVVLEGETEYGSTTVV